jgi:hypothetical protein
MSNKSNNRGDAIAVPHGEWRIDSYNNALSTANDEQMDQVECIVSIQEDMIWFRYTIRCRLQ